MTIVSEDHVSKSQKSKQAHNYSICNKVFLFFLISQLNLIFIIFLINNEKVKYLIYVIRKPFPKRKRKNSQS